MLLIGDKNARVRESLEIKGFARARKGFIALLNELEFRAQSLAEPEAPGVPQISADRSLSINIGVLSHMNTKMILAALALSLSIAGCAKQEEAPAPEAAAPVEEAAPAEEAPAAEAAAEGEEAAAPAEGEAAPAEAPQQ